MSLLTIVQSAAKNVGIAPPTSAQGMDPDAIKLVQFVNETGQEMVRRVDWSALTKRRVINGTGLNDRFPLADDHGRMIKGQAVSFGGAPVRGGLSSDEWFSLTPSENTPRYFHTFGKSIEFYPYPPSGAGVSVAYQSLNWARTSSAVEKSTMSTDTDFAAIPEDVLAQGVTWRFLRHAGKDYSDYLAEYEASLADQAVYENAERMP
jgi:hypothetical protein